jgi:tocopherol O-methyltransferase
MIFPNQVQGSEDVAGHYDELDRVYRELWGEHVHHGLWERGNETAEQAVEMLVAKVASALDPKPGEHLCDIGCGYGATAEWLARNRQVEVTGFTLSSAQAARAVLRRGRLRFHVRDWLDNGIADAQFDRAYAIESSEHMVDKQRFFDEAWRTLKPGGRLVICAWLARENARPAEVGWLLEPICREGRLPSMGSRDDYVGMARASGFELRGYEDLSRHVRRTWAICARRFASRLVTSGYYRRLVLNRGTRNRSFLLSVPRLILAYRTGSMRYGLFVLDKPLA